MDLKRSAVVLGVSGLLMACGGTEPVGGAVEEAGPDEQGGTVTAMVYTDHAIVTCQSATMYGNYSTTSGPRDPIRTLGYGDKVGIRQDAGTASWAVILDYGPDDWGYLLRSCMTRCYGPNNPIAGCF
ncbi:hypothetical protein D7V97_17510 [Corallococcus sp. CA053C]|uniref:hypothetical protein n=1 Tax=Corallococcus sp. CA053C TaxID=2316732 RepID=UPI000EA08B41|nr:hypothetical protein [Corallococcus sp. CA053C]RKH09108.1 hypothetical protein D7V97_17510 [Corallococcus sp. CA053C]